MMQQAAVGTVFAALSAMTALLLTSCTDVTSDKIIAALGNIGNSRAPRLHLHVMTTPDPLRSDGLPFVLTRFELTNRPPDMGVLDQLEAGKPARIQAGFQTSDQSELSPMVLDVMTYGNS